MTKKNTQTPADRLNKAVDAIIKRLDKAETFVLEQAPDVCKEIIAEKKAVAVYNIRCCVAVALLSGLAACASYMVGGEGGNVCCVIFSVGAMVLTGCSLAETQELIRLKAAPKLIILRQLRYLIR